MISKINFYVRCRRGGGFVARAEAPALEAEAATLAGLRAAIRKAVRAKLGGDHAIRMLVGESAPAPRMSLVAPVVEALVEGYSASADAG
jgi:hypothetical protein